MVHALARVLAAATLALMLVNAASPLDVVAYENGGPDDPAALDEPMLRKTLLNAVLWSAGVEVPPGGVRSTRPEAVMRADLATAPAQPGAAQADATTFHRDSQRTGWFTHGAMRAQAAGLSRRDIEALADYLK